MLLSHCHLLPCSIIYLIHRPLVAEMTSFTCQSFNNMLGRLLFYYISDISIIWFVPELLMVLVCFSTLITGYQTNRGDGWTSSTSGKQNCFHYSQLENVRNPNNLQYLQWRSKTLFPSAEICFYVTAGSGSPQSHCTPLSWAAKSQHMHFIINCYT